MQDWFSYQDIHPGPAMMVHVYNLRTLGGQCGTITWAQEFETILATRGDPVFAKNKKIK